MKFNKKIKCQIQQNSMYIYFNKIFNSLHIAVKTWLRNSYDLIDYESSILVKSSLNLRKSEYVYREYNDIYSKSELISNDEDIEKLMRIDVYQSQMNSFFEFERNKYGKDETDNIITPNSAWFLLRPSMIDDRMNKYKLSQGEVIKIGRITMRIRDIIFEGKNTYNMNDSSLLNESIVSKSNVNELQTLKTEGGTLSLKYHTRNKSKKFRNKLKTLDNFETIEGDKGNIKVNVIRKKDLKKNINLYTKIEKKNKVCRICYMPEEDEDNNPLVQPCICDGSCKYIHLQCLSQWIHTHSCEKLETNNKCSIYLIKPVECELCKTKFPDYIKFKNKYFPLINFTNDYKSYLTLESLTLDKYHNKFIYVVSLEKDRKIPLGKNQNCEIILSDRSIESVHCFMIVKNKQIYLEDNDSKFGTLVLVQANRIKLYQDVPLYLQIGRSFLELVVKKEFKLFDCCVSDEKNNIYSYYEQNEKYLKKDVSLTVKNEDEESESYLKNNNNTQEVKLYDYNNNSVNIGQKDKMSESEFLQIKRNKRNRNIKKNIYSNITYEPKEKDIYDNESNKENRIEDDKKKNQNNENKENNNESSEEIKIESEDNSTENKKDNNNNNKENENKNKINNSWNYNNNSENNKIENLENFNIKEDNIDDNLVEETQKIDESIKDENIKENERNNDNNKEKEELQNKENKENNEPNKENEIKNLNESKKSELKDDVSVIEI